MQYIMDVVPGNTNNLTTHEVKQTNDVQLPPIVEDASDDGWVVRIRKRTVGTEQPKILSEEIQVYFTESGNVVYHVVYPVIAGLLVLGVDESGYPTSRMLSEEQKLPTINTFELLNTLGISNFAETDPMDAFTGAYHCIFSQHNLINLRFVVTNCNIYGDWNDSEQYISYHLDNDHAIFTPEWTVVFQLTQNGAAIANTTTLYAKSLTTEVVEMLRNYLSIMGLNNFHDLINFWCDLKQQMEAVKAGKRDRIIIEFLSERE